MTTPSKHTPGAPTEPLDTVLFATQCNKVSLLGANPPPPDAGLPAALLETLRSELDDVRLIPSPPSAAAAAAADAAAATTTKTTTRTTTRVRTSGPEGAVHVEVQRTLSVRVRAGEYRPAVERYYAGLDRRAVEPVHSFAVLVGSSARGRARRLTVDLGAGTITRLTRDGRRAKTRIALRDLVQVVQSAQDPRLALLRLRNGTTGYIRFTTMVDRERFYALCWAGQCRHCCSSSHSPSVGAAAAAVEEEQDSMPMSIFVGTFNMMDTALAEAPERWLAEAAAHDVAAVCAQECSESAFRALVAPLARTHVEVAHDGLRHVKLAVFVRARHVRLVRAVETARVATGLAGVVGRKGAVAVAFALADTSLCVVGSHLAAHEPHYAARNSQYAEIVRDLRLGHPAADILNQFDHVVWCGDLNYRVTLPVAESLPYIRARQYAALLAHDQLTRARSEKHAFVDFAEGRITFAPTYKLARSVYTTSATAPAPAPASGTTSPSPTRSSSSGSGSGNTNSGGSSRHAQAEGGYVTKRNPSWCDRVLWKSSLAATPLTPAVYTSSGALTSSDHCPVHAVLRTHVLLPPAPGPRVPLTLSFKGALTAADLAWPACCAAATDTAPTVTLTFLAPFLDPTRVHAVSGKPRSASPAWAEGEIPDLPTCVCDPVYLAHRALTVVFSVVCPRFEATFGRAVIPLGNGAASHPPTTDGVRFTTRITLRGRPVGKLSGTVCIFPTPSDDSCP